jgi:hypothetical protein
MMDERIISSTIQAALILLSIVLAVGVFTGLIWFGFRMGRMTVGKPLPPIVKPKPVHLVEEDPYFEPMNGRPQPNIPTMEGR